MKQRPTREMVRFLRSKRILPASLPLLTGIMLAGLSHGLSRLPEQSPARLSAGDKSEVVEIFRLKRDLGDKIWPGYAAADIPLILFNGHTEFLVAEKAPPPGWTAVEGDNLEGQPYFQRPSEKSQAFAVKIGAHWAGSLGTLDTMNASMSLKLSPDFHIAAALHEMFHAYEADAAPARFREALAAYGVEARYPFKDKDFAAAWKNEGAALHRALSAADQPAALEAARLFLELREARRSRAGLGSDLIDYERDMEWLEGLAKYAEVYYCARFAKVPGGETPAARPRPGFFPVVWDFARLANNLGGQEGDIRFYMSGMAQARLLDRVDPAWKIKSGLDKLRLEDVLRAAVQRAGKVTGQA